MLPVLNVTAEVAVLNWTMHSKKRLLPICQYPHSLQVTEVGWHFKVSVNADEVKKVDGASICALLTPSPLFRIGRDA